MVVPPTDPTDHILRSGQAIALVGLAIAIAWEWVRARQGRSRAARLVADLALSPPIGALRDHLATVLADPGLRLLYPSAGGALVDAAGPRAELDPPACRLATPVLRGGAVIAIIEHDADVLRDQGEVDEVVAAARLGLEHERLQAELRAQLDALRLARRRIVEAGDAQRKHMERDLHDGAQQHLITLSIGLKLLERDPRTSRLLDEAAEQVDQALDDLRGVAHGIYPAILDDEGLAAAVDALAEGSAVPVTIRELADDRCPPSVEIAAYQLVVAAIQPDPLSELTPRELDVLALMAEGHSNRAIETALVVSPKTMEAHIRQIFMKLGFDEAPDRHRRVLAVLASLRRRA